VNHPGLHDQPDGIVITPTVNRYVANIGWHSDADRHGHETRRESRSRWR
jgi:hypothetical protein